jgi:hypothetical protein
MVLDGRGLETYRTPWLVEFNWIGLLIFLVAAPVALAVALVFRWREERQWRQVERKMVCEMPTAESGQDRPLAKRL